MPVYNALTYAFLGDCWFNMGRSLLVMGALMGSDVRLAGPAELYPPKDVADLARNIAGRTGARITITEDPPQAVAGADFIHGRMGLDGGVKRYLDRTVRLLAPCHVNADLMGKALNPVVKFMHCLPAFHDTRTVVGREIMEHTGMTSGLEGNRRGVPLAGQHRLRPGREPAAYHQGRPRRHPRITRVGLHELRVDAGLYARLLGDALRLTIGLGTVLALVLAGGTRNGLPIAPPQALAPRCRTCQIAGLSGGAHPSRGDTPGQGRR